MKISIIVPIYNVGELFLSKCLQSLINQTYNDIEIICVNDGSTDNSLQVIEHFAKQDIRIKIINQENKGVSVARNQGLEVAKGDYILFVDSDDTIDLNTCKILSEQTKNNNDLIIFDYISISQNMARKVTKTNLKDPSDMIMQTLCVCRLYKKSFLIKNNIKFPEVLTHSEDLVFTSILYCYNPTIACVNEYLYLCCTNRESSATHDWAIRISQDIKSYKFLIETDLYNNLPECKKLFITDYWARTLFTCWSDLPDKRYQKQYNEQIDSFLKNYKKFNKKDYKNLIGYKRIKNKFWIKLLKKIRNLFFLIIYRKRDI